MKYIGVVCALFSLKRPFSDNFWLNINDPRLSFNGIIEQTNLNQHLRDAGLHLIYVPYYLPTTEPRYSYTDEQLYAEYYAMLRLVNPAFEENWIKERFIARAPYAQAVCSTHFADLIPPVPLALKSAGIYHQVAKTSEGYLVEYVPPSMSRFWRKWDDPFNYSPGESVYCYTAVFAPGKVRVPVRHVWSRKTPHGWVRTDSIGFPISGGREGGYRGYTAKSGITLGKWRVEVETEGGRTLGRIDFAVVPSPVPHPSLVTALIR